MLAAGILGVSLVLFPQQLQAQAATRDSTSPVTIGGFVDGYFSWNFGRPRSHINRLANFDLTENQIVMSTAEIDVQKATTPVGFHIELAAGSAPDIINAGSPESAKLFQQAYLSAVIPVGAGLTVDAGKFVTHMGFETIKAKDNFNYSRSFLFAWAIPYYHTGVRASYPLRDNLTATLHICNGWNNVSANSGKTFGASISFAPTSSLFTHRQLDWRSRTTRLGRFGFQTRCRRYHHVAGIGKTCPWDRRGVWNGEIVVGNGNVEGCCTVRSVFADRDFCL